MPAYLLSKQDTERNPWVIPDCFEGAGWTTWFALAARDEDAKIQVVWWGQGGDFRGWREEVNLKAAVHGVSGPHTWTFNGAQMDGVEGAFTFGVVVLEGGPVHVTKRLQRT